MVHGRFIGEPRGHVYRGLVAALGATAHRILFVERIMHTHDGRILGGFDTEGERLRLALQPWCVIEEERSAWPGTVTEGSVLVREYTVSLELIATLQSAVDGLYEWQAGLPEDLAFLRESGEDMMFATSHEEDGALTLHAEERDRLLRECPAVDECIEWDR